MLFAEIFLTFLLHGVFKIVNLYLSTIFRNSEKIFFSDAFPVSLHEFRDVFFFFFVSQVTEEQLHLLLIFFSEISVFQIGRSGGT